MKSSGEYALLWANNHINKMKWAELVTLIRKEVLETPPLMVRPGSTHDVAHPWTFDCKGVGCDLAPDVVEPEVVGVRKLRNPGTDA